MEAVHVGTSGWQYDDWRGASIRRACRSGGGSSTTGRVLDRGGEQLVLPAPRAGHDRALARSDAGRVRRAVRRAGSSPTETAEGARRARGAAVGPGERAWRTARTRALPAAPAVPRERRPAPRSCRRSRPACGPRSSSAIPRGPRTTCSSSWTTLGPRSSGRIVPGARATLPAVGGWLYVRFHQGTERGPSYRRDKLRRWASRIGGGRSRGVPLLQQRPDRRRDPRRAHDDRAPRCRSRGAGSVTGSSPESPRRSSSPSMSFQDADVHVLVLLEADAPCRSRSSGAGSRSVGARGAP